METIQGLNNVFCHFPSGEYQVSNAALSIMCRKARSVLERVYAVKSHHNTSDGAKPGLQEHSPASAAPCLHCPWLWMCCTAQHPLKGTKRKCKEGDNKTWCGKAKCPHPGVLSALKFFCPKVPLHSEPAGCGSSGTSGDTHMRQGWGGELICNSNVVTEVDKFNYLETFKPDFRVPHSCVFVKNDHLLHLLCNDFRILNCHLGS